MNPFVIAVSGISGAGKTKLVGELARVLDGAAIGFDEYIGKSILPTELAEWVREGGDPNVWRTPQMAADLLALREGRAIETPGGRRVEPREIVIVEDPFGKARPEVAALIDLAVFLRIPLEIALARKLLRDLSIGSLKSDPHESRDYVVDFLERYLSSVRDFYRMVGLRAEEACELSLNGEESTSALAQAVIGAVKSMRHFPQSPPRD